MTTVKKMRVFIPTTAKSIKRWVWTLSKGLMVEFTDGAPPRRSDWGSLAEFLRAIKEGRELATEVEPSTTFLVCMLDLYGRPCAWGSAKNREAAEAEARRQLAAWVAKKDPREVFEPFTPEVREMFE